MMRRLSVLGILAVIACSEKIVEPAPAPDRPTALSAVMQPPKSVRLTWTPVAPVEGSIVYTVYRNDAKLGETSGTEFVDSTVTSNSSYTWYVSAKAASGRVSAPSDPVILAIGDIEPPRVVANTPSANATGVSRIPLATVTFSEPMIPLSVTRGGITAKITQTGQPVYGTINYNASTRAADFWPISILPARTQITVSVNAADVAGNAFAAPFTFSFTTGDDPSGVDALPRNDHPFVLSRSFPFSPAPNISSVTRDIIKVRIDGSDPIRITNDLNNDLDPAWSPDGRHIAFASNRDGTFDIFVMREDGTGVTQLTFGDRDQLQPHWSPDGSRLVFQSFKDGVPPPGFSIPADIWIMNADGSGQTNLTKSPTVFDHSAMISPDGTRILYTSANRFVVSNIDGSNAHLLKAADPRFIEDRAAWSPDGNRIAYSAFNVNHPAFNENFLLFIVDPDGSNVVQVTTAGSQRGPGWSPDGKSLVYSISGEDEFWGRFGKIGAATLNLETRAFMVIGTQTPASEVSGPQSWTR